MDKKQADDQYAANFEAEKERKEARRDRELLNLKEKVVNQRSNNKKTEF